MNRCAWLLEDQGFGFKGVPTAEEGLAALERRLSHALRSSLHEEPPRG
jgi:hypothetical protein